MRGKGKTNYVKGHLFDDNISPCYIVDIRNEFKHIPAFTDVTSFYYWLCKNDTKLLRMPSDMSYCKPGQYRFTFNSTREYSRLYEMLKHLRNSTLVIDEADAIFTSRQFEKPIIDIFLGSRNNNVSMLFLGKRPSLIPIIVRSQADTYRIFCVEEEWDIKYLEKRVKQSFPKDVYKLERGEAIVFRSGEKPVVEVYPKFIGEL